MGILMNAKEVALIIRACKSAGVSDLKYEGLEVKFGRFEENYTLKPQSTIFLDETTSPTDSQLKLIDDEPQAQEKYAEDLSEEMLAITNPMEWMEKGLRDDTAEEA